MTKLVRLAAWGLALATLAAPALAADENSLFGAPAISAEELGTHRAKGDEINLDQYGNPGQMGMTAPTSGTPATGTGQNAVNLGQNGSFRGVAVGVQSGTVSQSGTIH
ncbi:MAG: hypothetical protein U1F33_14510 [Alphaproteobacteria bacterium]